jgi:hypothetical protein
MVVVAEIKVKLILSQSNYTQLNDNNNNQNKAKMTLNKLKVASYENCGNCKLGSAECEHARRTVMTDDHSDAPSLFAGRFI